MIYKVEDLTKKNFGYKNSPSKYGIYGYYDKVNDVIAYIGKCSNIIKGERAYQHLVPSKTNKTSINAELSKHPKNYEYWVLSVNSDYYINEIIEQVMIDTFLPKHNKHHNIENYKR